MKAKLLRTLLPLALVFTMISCSTESEGSAGETELIKDYEYDQMEIELANLINNYRESIGLNTLQTINHISFKSAEHNDYMIANNVVNHDFFQQRSQNIIQVLGAIKVNENVAYNYNTPQAALNAWVNSSGHKTNIEGDFTHFGISISIDPETGRKYYTNIFIKK